MPTSPRQPRTRRCLRGTLDEPRCPIALRRECNNGRETTARTEPQDHDTTATATSMMTTRPPGVRGPTPPGITLECPLHFDRHTTGRKDPHAAPYADSRGRLRDPCCPWDSRPSPSSNPSPRACERLFERCRPQAHVTLFFGKAKSLSCSLLLGAPTKPRVLKDFSGSLRSLRKT